MHVGDIEITPIHDGCWRLQAPMMYGNTAEDWLQHRQFLYEYGMLPC